MAILGRMQCGIGISVGIGEAVESPNCLAHAYNQASKIIKMKKLGETRLVLSVPDQTGRKLPEAFYLGIGEKQFLKND